MSMKIIFTNTLEFDLESPQPASKCLPDWYKHMPSYFTNTGKKTPNIDGITSTSTVKRCVPVFDVITAGYILTSPADIYTDLSYQDPTNSGTPSRVRTYSFPSANLIEFHPIEQVTNHPLQKTTEDMPKFINPWAIRTPKGYSCLFIQPFHRESVFTIMPGIVDTDSYLGFINFPFVLNNPEFVGLIPKGTPIAQVIPFKRTSWKSELGNKGDVKKALSHMLESRTTFFDYYRRRWHIKKEYK